MSIFGMTAAAKARVHKAVRGGFRTSSARGSTAASTIGSSNARPTRLSGRNRYSLFVSFMKVVLPAAAAGLVLLVAVWPQFTNIGKRFALSISDLKIDDVDSLTMVNARFDGHDSKNQPFSITADEAKQATGASDKVALTLPKADITLKSGNWVALTARDGIYDRKQETLELKNDVNLFHDDGFELRTQSALVDLKTGVAEGSDPVDAQSPYGTLQSEGFRVEERGARIFFTGKSELLLFSATASELK